MENYPILNEPGKGRYAIYFRLNERAVMPYGKWAWDYSISYRMGDLYQSMRGARCLARM